MVSSQLDWIEVGGELECNWIDDQEVVSREAFVVLFPCLITIRSYTVAWIVVFLVDYMSPSRLGFIDRLQIHK